MTPPDAEAMTDPRLAEAQARAAELVAELEGVEPTAESQHLEGWAQAVAALRHQCDKAKWAWQFISATALDGHNREHDGRVVALAECPEAPCPGWREDLQGYQNIITDSDEAIRRFCDAMLGARDEEASLKRGLEDRNAGRMRPWSEVKDELGGRDA